MTQEYGVIPPGKSTGCLPRRTAPGAHWRIPMASERIDVIPRDRWDEYKGIDNIRFIRHVLDQDGVGSCAAEATTQALMISREQQGQNFVPLNPWFMYHTTSGGRDYGSLIEDNLEFAMDKGIAPESIWPRSKGWRATPSDEAYEEAKKYRIAEAYDITSLDELISAVLCGFAVVYGAKGHAVCLVKHVNEQEGLVINSWGTDWGDNGLGVWVPYRQIDFQYGAFAVRASISQE